MAKKIESKTNLQAAIDDLLASTQKPESVPDGWKTSDEWAKASKISLLIAQRKLRHLLDEGLWEMKMFRVQRGKSIRPFAHYRKKP